MVEQEVYLKVVRIYPEGFQIVGLMWRPIWNPASQIRNWHVGETSLLQFVAEHWKSGGRAKVNIGSNERFRCRIMFYKNNKQDCLYVAVNDRHLVKTINLDKTQFIRYSKIFSRTQYWPKNSSFRHRDHYRSYTRSEDMWQNVFGAHLGRHLGFCKNAKEFQYES